MPLGVWSWAARKPDRMKTRMATPRLRGLSRRSALVVSFALAWSAAGGSIRAQSPSAAPETVRILFIGNSYTYFNDLPRMLQSMAPASSKTLRIELGAALEGGATLRSHWNKRTIDLVRNGNRDFVVLQEQSLAPIQATRDFIAYGERFGQEIRAAKAQPVLFLTWSRQNRPSAQDSLNRAYRRLGDLITATVVPVGPAWQELQRLDTTAKLYTDDGSHPSPLGSFIAATTFYRTLFGELPVRSYTANAGLSSRTLTLVHRAVETAVGRFQQR